MLLTELLRHKSLVILGLNSGTSADGLDLAAVRIGRRGRAIDVSLLAGDEKRFPPALRTHILELADSPRLTFSDFLKLHNELGDFAGRTARSFIRRLLKRRILVDAIAWHGQTVGHFPKLHRIGRTVFSGTLQIGLPELVAAITDRLVVSDLRQAAVALGQEGAPITVAAMFRLFATRSESRLIVNIGGMANYFFFPRAGSVSDARAADCGPGNVLVDLLMQELYGQSFDRGGKIGAAGRINDGLLQQLRKHPFFEGKVTSTGRETFGPEMVQQIVQYGRAAGMADADLLATTAELTAQSIAKAVVRHSRSIAGPTKLYLTGGGRRNKLFVRRLRHHLPNVEIDMIDTLGIPGGLVEAASFAVMGEAALRSEALPTRFDGKRGRAVPVSGRIVQPPQQLPT